MIKCSKCGRELEDNAKFCVQCGAPVADSDTAVIVCQHCGGKTPAGSAFCQNCGAALSGESDLTVPPVGEDDPPAKKSVFSRLPLKLSKKVMAIGGSCLAV